MSERRMWESSKKTVTPDPEFVLRGNCETTVNYVKFLQDAFRNITVLWTANGDGKGVRVRVCD